MLDVEPARCFMQVTKRESGRAKRAEQGGCSPPVRIIDRAWFRWCNHRHGDEQVRDHTLYRQSVALLRDAGIDQRATMCGWVMI